MSPSRPSPQKKEKKGQKNNGFVGVMTFVRKKSLI